MTGVALSVVAGISTWLAGRRSAGSGLALLMTWGYFYGILRAYVPGSAGYFLFDAAVVCLYAARLAPGSQGFHRLPCQSLKAWVFVLCGWPLLLLFLPFQPFLISLVGLRAIVLPIPAILIGASLKHEDMSKLTLTFCVLNMLVLSFALLEYTLGLEVIIPHNQATEMIFQSRDVANFTAYRIPATFTNAHVYAATMLCSIPFLFGAWVQRNWNAFARRFLVLGLGAALVGVLLSATRMPFIFTVILILFATLTTKLGARRHLMFCTLLLCISISIVKNERLQRFTSLTDTDRVEQRIAGSVNRTFVELLIDHPMGNGLGGGGTSIPYFLQSSIQNPVGLESEYTRIMLEQSAIGLLLWVAFLLWVFTRPIGSEQNGRRLAWLTCLLLFSSGLIGIGIFTSIPTNVLLFSMVGWFSTRHSPDRTARVVAWARPTITRPFDTTAEVATSSLRKVQMT